MELSDVLKKSPNLTLVNTRIPEATKLGLEELAKRDLRKTGNFLSLMIREYLPIRSLISSNRKHIVNIPVSPEDAIKFKVNEDGNLVMTTGHDGHATVLIIDKEQAKLLAANLVTYTMYS